MWVGFGFRIVIELAWCYLIYIETGVATTVFALALMYGFERDNVAVILQKQLEHLQQDLSEMLQVVRDGKKV